MGALDGIQVLELAQGIHGPYAAMLLADMGASVIKIEPPQGELNRSAAVVQGKLTIGSQFYACNRNKRVMCIDLKTEEGRVIVRHLAGRSDVLVENMRAGVLDKYGLGFEEMAALNPRLVYATGSSYGPEGPDAALASLDIVAQAAGGIVAHTGTAETGPLPAGAAIADHAGALWLAWGITVALLARERTGRGQRVTSSLLGGQIGLQAWEMSYFLLTGTEPPSAGPGHPLARGPWRIFATRDGYIGIGGVTDKNWAGLCSAIERPDLVDDPRFAAATQRIANTDALLSLLEPLFREKSTADLVRRLRANGQVVAPVADYAALAADPQVQANQYLTVLPTEEFGDLPMVGLPVQLSDTPGMIRSRPPDIDTHTADILRELGYGDSDVARLYAERVVGAST
jgi:formyl-CoA transferase/CoA:oxalate CoA-transferase